jgi:hypothetical protein
MANNFRLTLDTLAPVGGFVGTLPEFINENKSVEIEVGDATFIRYWFDTEHPEHRPDGWEEYISAQ